MGRIATRKEMTYKHHIIPFHEWRRRINPKATRHNKDFNALDNVTWLSLEQHTEVHKRMGEDGSKWDWISYLSMSGQIGREEAIKQAVILANTGRKQSLEQRQRQSERMKGKQHGLGWKAPLEFRIKQSEIHRGVPRSKEFCEKQSLKRRGVPVRKLTCPHCHMEGGCSNMVRYHFDNCREKHGRI